MLYVNVCNRCHDIAILQYYYLAILLFSDIKGSDYGCIVRLISKNVPIKLMQNADLTEKSETLYKKWKVISQKKIFFESVYKDGKSNYKILWYWNPKAKVSPT